MKQGVQRERGLLLRCKLLFGMFAAAEVLSATVACDQQASDGNELEVVFRSSEPIELDGYDVLYDAEKSIDEEDSVVVVTEAGAFSSDLLAYLRQPWERHEDGHSYARIVRVEREDDGSAAVRDVVLRSDEAFPFPQLGEVDQVGDGVPAAVSALGFISNASARTQAHELVDVIIRLAGFEETRLPQVPRGSMASSEEVARVLAHRSDLIASASSAYSAKATRLLQRLDEVGTVTEIFPTWGLVVARVRPNALTELATREDVARLTGNPVLQKQNDDVLGTIRAPTLTQHDLLFAQGYEGYAANLAVIEQNWPVLGCYLAGFRKCQPDRVEATISCGTQPGCQVTQPIAQFSDTHATRVVSIAAGGYHEQQANPNTGPGEFPLPPGWRNGATGFAREAGVHVLRAGSSSTIAKAINCATGDVTENPACAPVDLINLSQGSAASICSHTSNGAYEIAIEEAFEQNVPTVVAAGNEGDLNNCKVLSPADTPLAITVGEVKTLAPGLSYSDYGRPSTSPFGGADGNFGGVNRLRTVSMVDLVAPGDMVLFTGLNHIDPFDPDGEIRPSWGELDGTSYSAPVVAGIATIVRERWLPVAPVDEAGILTALLLSMTDRAALSGELNAEGDLSCLDAANSKLFCGADLASGLGRVKVTEPVTVDFFQGQFVALPAPPLQGSFLLKANTKMVKCVVFQAEPMRDKADFSHIELDVQIREKPAGGCQTDEGLIYMSRWDDNYDVKHMVAITDDEVSLGSRCLQWNVDPNSLSGANHVNFYGVCYANDAYDDEVD